MKVSALKTEKRVERANWRGYHIQAYGKDNDYPQRLREIVGASVTGASCMEQYRKFIIGRGFAQKDFYSAELNRYNQTADDLLQRVAEDYAMYAGFALLLNWNANYKITEIQHVPFEMVRLGELDEDGHFDKYAVHPDWGKRLVALRPFRTKDIVYFDRYDPRPEIIREQVEDAGGWDKWNGQILYYSRAGRDCYPVPTYDAAVTDMSTEEGLANVALRNVRNNFLPAGMLIDRNNTANTKNAEEETKQELKEFQGDTNAGKLFYVNLQGGDVEPEFKPFKSNNTDKDFVVTGEKAPDNIGRAFNQPPILRAQDVGANFGADLMRNAYDYYNSVTDTEREDVSRVFAMVMEYYVVNVNPEGDYSILPKKYRINTTLAERLGDNTDKVLELLYDADKSEQSKRVVFSRVYGLDEDDIDELLKSL